MYPPVCIFRRLYHEVVRLNRRINYFHHAFIGVGTAGFGVVVAEAFGLHPLPLVTLGIGALVVGIGSIATDLDQP